LVLCSIFELPDLVQPDRLSLSAVRVPGDVLVTALLALWLSGTRTWRWARSALTVFALVLLLYRSDAALCRVLMRHPPELYDQLFLLRHLAVLIADLWGGWAWLIAAGVLAVLVAVARGVRLLIDACASGLRARCRELRTAALLGALLFAGLELAHAVSWTTPELVRSTIEARRLAQRIAHGIERSPYRAYERLALRRKPNVFVFFVESYGRVLASDSSTADDWRSALGDMERDLAADGYSFASAFASAPVSGGRSWLAHASIFTGVHIGFQALYQSLFPNGRARVPHLPGLLHHQGYRTVLLAPADRERPGVHEENPYGYDETIRSAELSYRGPSFGWGRVPDQYSLAYAQERVFTRRDRPLFFVFTMVSSHALWNEVPELVGDARDPHAYERMKLRVQTGVPARSEGHGMLIDQTRRYSRKSGPAGPPASAAPRRAYARSVLYDLELLRRALRELHGDDLIVVLGDHQPPLLTSEHDDFAAPVHIFARDPTLLAEALAHGFLPKLALDPHAETALPHEALFSLLVRTLLRAGGTSASSLPPFLPNGVQLAE
jgi:hypothetical protein